MGFSANVGVGDTPQTVTTTRAPAVSENSQKELRKSAEIGKKNQHFPLNFTDQHPYRERYREQSWHKQREI